MSENERRMPEPQQDRSSALLVQAIVDRTPGAEEDLFRSFQGAVSAVIAGMAPWGSDTEDLVQETFRLVIEKVRARQVREPDRLPGFICGLARNLALTQRRRGLRAPVASDAEPTAEPDQLSRMLEQESVRMVRDLLRELTPERDREILFRFYLDEQDKDTICRDLDLTSLHFNRVLYRARERFRELWARKMKP